MRFESALPHHPLSALPRAALNQRKLAIGIGSHRCPGASPKSTQARPSPVAARRPGPTETCTGHQGCLPSSREGSGVFRGGATPTREATRRVGLATGSTGVRASQARATCRSSGVRARKRHHVREDRFSSLPGQRHSASGIACPKRTWQPPDGARRGKRIAQLVEQRS
jgi:hypothetical protein